MIKLETMLKHMDGDINCLLSFVEQGAEPQIEYFKFHIWEHMERMGKLIEEKKKRLEEIQSEIEMKRKSLGIKNELD